MLTKQNADGSTTIVINPYIGEVRELERESSLASRQWMEERPALNLLYGSGLVPLVICAVAGKIMHHPHPVQDTANIALPVMLLGGVAGFFMKHAIAITHGGDRTINAKIRRMYRGDPLNAVLGQAFPDPEEIGDADIIEPLLPIHEAPQSQPKLGD